MSSACSSCSALNSPGATFCDQCGTRLIGDQVEHNQAASMPRPENVPEVPTPLSLNDTSAPASRPSSLPETSADPGRAAGPAGLGWRPTPAGPTASGSTAQGVSAMVEAVVESAAKPRRGNRIIGEVRNLRERQETDNSQKNWTIWSFRVESFDRAGNRLQPVPVEMRARSFRGTLSEGDQVEIRGRWREGQTLRVKEAYNATTRTRVKARGNGASIWFWNIVFFIVAGLALILFCGVLDQASSGWF